jgi:hypothetical protein
MTGHTSVGDDSAERYAVYIGRESIYILDSLWSQGAKIGVLGVYIYGKVRSKQRNPLGKSIMKTFYGSNKGFGRFA